MYAQSTSNCELKSRHFHSSKLPTAVFPLLQHLVSSFLPAIMATSTPIDPLLRGSTSKNTRGLLRVIILLTIAAAAVSARLFSVIRAYTLRLRRLRICAESWLTLLTRIRKYYSRMLVPRVPLNRSPQCFLSAGTEDYPPSVISNTLEQSTLGSTSAPRNILSNMASIAFGIGSTIVGCLSLGW